MVGGVIIKQIINCIENRLSRFLFAAGFCRLIYDSIMDQTTENIHLQRGHKKIHGVQKDKR